jgi:hypothetical protein
MALSSRGIGIASNSDIPWRYPLSCVYDAKTNPDGMIAFSTAENVSPPNGDKVICYITDTVRNQFLVADELDKFAQTVSVSTIIRRQSRLPATDMA